jgi:excisionase family DNA binding protein
MEQLAGGPSQDGLLRHIAKTLSEMRRRYSRDGLAFPIELESIRLLCVTGAHSRSQFDAEAASELALLMTYASAARRLAISNSSLRRLIAAGDLPTVLVGGSVRIAESDLVAYAETLDRRRIA